MGSTCIHYLQHVPFEGLGCIDNWAASVGCAVTRTRLYDDEPLPDPRGLGSLFVMGGPMGADDGDRFPWIEREKKFIERIIELGRPVIGICLGAQMLASVLGARIYRNTHREIGWFPVTMTAAALSTPLFAGFPESLTVFNWHGDTFDRPAGLFHCAGSPACKNQMFLYNEKVLGIQFHFEANPQGVGDLINECRDEMTPGEYVQDEAVIREYLSNAREANRLMDCILEKMIKNGDGHENR